MYNYEPTRNKFHNINNSTQTYNYKNNWHNQYSVPHKQASYSHKYTHSNLNNKTNYEKEQTTNSQNILEASLHNLSASAEPLFEILGIKIYFDDILIICILLFLYEEGIHDQYLFLSLIFLLLS